MKATVVHHASGVDLTLRVPGLLPATIRAATLDAAVSCARSIVADERYKMLAMLDGIDAALVGLTDSPASPDCAPSP